MATPQPDPVSPLTRAKVFVLAAVVPPAVGYAAVAGVLALVIGIAPHAGFSTSGVLGAALPAWLAAHQVPIAIAGAEFGALPLLPTLLVMVLAGRSAARATTQLGLRTLADAGLLVGSIAAAHGICGLACALAQPSPLVTVDPLAALYYPALIAAVASAVGLLRSGGLAGELADRVDDVARRGLAAGGFAVALLLTAGAAVTTLGLVTSASTVRELFAGYAPGVGAGIGMLLLCLGYLPNAVVAGTAFVAGPGFGIGALDVSPLEFTGGRVPGLPLLAALPEEQAGWWPVLCLVPVGVGILLGHRLRHVADRPLARLRAVAVAVGVLAVVTVLLAGSAGGRLGGGAFDPLTMHAPAVSLVLVVVVGLPAAALAWFAAPTPPEREDLRSDTGRGDQSTDENTDTDEPPAADETSADADTPAMTPALKSVSAGLDDDGAATVILGEGAEDDTAAETSAGDDTPVATPAEQGEDTEAAVTAGDSEGSGVVEPAGAEASGR